MKKFLSALLLSILFVPTTLAATTYEEGYYIATVTANIRAQAGMQGQRIGYVQADEEIYVRAQKGQWCDVEYRTYEHAYVLCSLLEESYYDDDYSDDYYSDDDYYYDDEDDYYDSYDDYSDYDTLPRPTMHEPKPCDPAIATCSGDFKLSITADLVNTDPREDFHTMKINLHGQGRVNLKVMEHPEMSLSVNGSVQTEDGLVKGSMEAVIKEKGYLRVNDFGATNIPGFSASMNDDMQKHILGRWFEMPLPDTELFTSTNLMLGNPGAEEMSELVKMSKFIGTETTGSTTRYQYQLEMNDERLSQLLDMPHTGTPSDGTALINFWLDSSNRLVKGTATLKMPSSDSEPVSGTLTISFDSSSLNQDIHVTAPESAEPLPRSFPASAAMLPF